MVGKLIITPQLKKYKLGMITQISQKDRPMNRGP